MAIVFHREEAARTPEAPAPRRPGCCRPATSTPSVRISRRKRWILLFRILERIATRLVVSESSLCQLVRNSRAPPTASTSCGLSHSSSAMSSSGRISAANSCSSPPPNRNHMAVAKARMAETRRPESSIDKFFPSSSSSSNLPFGRAGCVSHTSWCHAHQRVSEIGKRVRGERQRLQDAQCRQRKKLQRQRLEEEAQQLQTQLSQLQQLQAAKTDAGPANGRRKPDPDESNWRDKAEATKQERVQAELLNMTLRRAVAQERRVARSLKTVMEKRPCLPRAVVCSIRRASCAQTTTSSQLSRCSQCCNPTTLHVNPSAVRREIDATLQQMHVHACAVLNATASDDSLSFNFNVRLDTSTGPTTEISTTIPMNCAVDRAVKLLGARCHVQGHGRHGGDRPQFTVELGSPHQTVLLDGFGASEKTNDGNRQLILWVAISFDRCGALCFRECSWLAIQRVANESIIRSHYTVTAEKAVGCSVIDGEHIDRVRDRALRAMGRQIKERYLAMQRSILLQTGRAHLVDFVGM